MWMGTGEHAVSSISSDGGVVLPTSHGNVPSINHRDHTPVTLDGESELETKYTAPSIREAQFILYTTLRPQNGGFAVAESTKYARKDTDIQVILREKAGTEELARSPWPATIGHPQRARHPYRSGPVLGEEASRALARFLSASFSIARLLESEILTQ